MDLRAGRLPALAHLHHDCDGDGVPDLLRIQPGEGFEVRLGLLERRSFEGRRWTTYRSHDEPWLEADLDLGARHGIWRSRGRPAALWFVGTEGVHRIPLPRGD